MIEAMITHDGEEIGRITFVKRREMSSDKTCAYIIQYGVERLGPQHAVGLYTRTIKDVDRTHTNALGLIFMALGALGVEELTLDQPTDTQDLARRLGGIGGKVQTWTSKLRRH